MAKLRQVKIRNAQTSDEIIFNRQRNVMNAARAVVVIGRAVIVVMAVGRRLFPFMGAAFIKNMAALCAAHFADGENTRTQSSKDAENQEPCKKVPHV